MPDLKRKKLALSSLFLGKDIGAVSFKSGESIFYRFVVYRGKGSGAESDLNFKIEILNGDAKTYEGDWQPLAPRIIRKDSQRIETGGILKTNIDAGFYTLRISVKDSKSKQTTQQTIDLELER